MRSARATHKARQVLADLNITSPEQLDVLLIAAHHNVFVRFRALAHEEGHMLRAHDRALVVVNQRARQSEKWRFVVAHELGHFLLHQEHDQLPICTDLALHSWYSSCKIEREANAFAAELLMPKALFSACCDDLQGDPWPSLDHVSMLATGFETSLTATALRFAQLTQRSVAVVHATKNHIDWCAQSPSFKLNIKPDTPLHQGSWAAALHSGQLIPAEPLPCASSAWDKHLQDAPARLVEHSIMMNHYASSLTLLCHD